MAGHMSFVEHNFPLERGACAVPCLSVGGYPPKRPADLATAEGNAYSLHRQLTSERRPSFREIAQGLAHHMWLREPPLVVKGTNQRTVSILELFFWGGHYFEIQSHIESFCSVAT